MWHMRLDIPNMMSHYAVMFLALREEKIKHHESIDMDSVQGGYEDSVLNLRQKSYRYLAWSYVAMAAGFIVVRQLMKAQ